MAAAQSYDNDGPEAAVPQPGKVHEVCRQWLVHEDAVVAHRMQEDEFDYKYGMNRFHRRTVRQDIPVAKEVHTEEEKRAQAERMRQLQEAKALAEKDEAIAKKYMQDMMLEEQRKKMSREMEDQELAIKMQEKEKLRYERKLRERELAKERKRLESNSRRAEEEMMAQYRLENREGQHESALSSPGDDLSADMGSLVLENGNRQPEKLLRVDGRVEDVGDFSDFYVQPVDSMTTDARKELQELQDEELARLLQDQEHKSKTFDAVQRGAQINKDKLKAIEAQDEELARVMQEQEKLKVRKKKHKNEAQRQMSQPAPGPYPLPSLIGGPPATRSHSSPMERTSGPRSYEDRPSPNGTLEENHYERPFDLIHTPSPNDPRTGPHSPGKPLRYSEDSSSPQQHRRQKERSHHRAREPERYQGAAAPSPPRHHHTQQPPSPSHPSHETITNPTNLPERSSPAHRSDHSSPAAQQNMNVFAAVDPTYNRDRDIMDPPSERIVSQTPPELPQRTPPQAAPVNEPYYDDEDEDFNPVPGQKRDSMKQGKKGQKKGSCKQQ